MSAFRRLVPALATAAATLLITSTLVAQPISPEQYENLAFRHIGPLGNRVASIAGVPGDRTTYFAGAASGGLWKTDDAGLHWRPVFDDQPVHSIGAIAVAPSDPGIVWVGTGESSIRSNVSIGNGAWKSTDGGETWEHMGLEGTGRVGRILIHPYDPDVVYMATLGHSYGPAEERGVYRTRDGGDTWDRILFVDQETGAYEMAMDPQNPRKIIATTWDLDLKTWKRDSGGPGSGIHVTTDGGDTWTELEGNGLPTGTLGKIAVCMSASNSDRVYALIETSDGVPMEGYETDTGELWRSDDGGETWNLTSYSHDLATRQAYYTRCGVSSDDPDEVYFLSSSYSVSRNGGETHDTFNFFGDQWRSPGWDHHDMWIDPTNGDRFAIAFDGGVTITENRGDSWFRVQLPIAQMYHVTADNAVPYNVMGNRQDGPSMHGPSNTRTQGFWSTGIIPRGMWRDVGGGESGFATPDPTDPNIVWSSASGSGARGGIVVRYDRRTGHYRDVEVWPMSTGGWPAEDLRFRFQWTFPLLISPHDSETIYVTSQHVHRTTNRGQSWEVVSPDLTTNDKSKQVISGGLTPDNIGVEYCCVIYAFDESPVQEGVLWAGSNDGLVQVSRDGGATWTNVTANIPNLPPDGVVRSIDASKWDVGKAYITIEHHQVGDFTPRAYKTEDFGETWRLITNGVDNDPVDYTRYLLEDPVREGLLYLGTETTLYVSWDDGASWQPFMNNLPSTPFYGIVVQEHFNDLVLGTYGRGFWILDDLGPIQQMTDAIAGSPAHLFEPRDAYRFRPTTEHMAMFEDWSAGQNPPPGASLNYWLADGGSPVQLRIEDSEGEVVQTLNGSANPGINRVWWNFTSQGPTQMKIRTKPLFADWMPMPETFTPSGGGGFFGGGGPLQPPGTYTVTLVVDGEDAGSQSLTVLKDPNSQGSLADIRAQRAMVQAIMADRNRAAELVNRIELLRRQIYDLRPVLEEAGDAEAVIEAGEALDEQLIEVESQLVQLKNTGGGDGVRWPSMIVGQLSSLQNSVQSADFPPTDQQGEVHTVLSQRLDDAESDLNAVIAGELAEFNRILQQTVGRVITTDQ
ncbi:MAG: sialidase [Gemmatimonadota bacterium]|nr:sialidase [Gemmatimonadota bacterium]